MDRGLVPLYGSKNETTSQGLDDLDERCKKYYQDGLRFAKFRAAFSINSEKGVSGLNYFLRGFFYNKLGSEGLRI